MMEIDFYKANVKKYKHIFIEFSNVALINYLQIIVFFENSCVSLQSYCIEVNNVHMFLPFWDNPLA